MATGSLGLKSFYPRGEAARPGNQWGVSGMDASTLIGLSGMVLIVIAWLVSIPERPPLRLSLIYFAGSVLLTIYSIMLRDPVFTTLNALAAALSLYNAARALRFSKDTSGRPSGG